MGLFSKTAQRILIANDDRTVIETIAAELRARKLQGTKVSAVVQADGRWQCSIDCNSAEALYNQELVPLLYDSTEAQSCELLLTFDDKNALVAHCSTELLVSFGFNSRYAFGNEAENAFLHELQNDIAQNFADMPAAVVYCIVGGAAVTFCVPCADPKAMEKNISKKLTDFKVKQFVVNVVDREAA